MAKKNTSDPNSAAAPKRAATRRTTKPVDEASVAADMSTGNNGNGTTARQPSADEIAQAAYQRYLSRGGTDGRDFDDWIEAERELANRNTR